MRQERSFRISRESRASELSPPPGERVLRRWANRFNGSLDTPSGKARFIFLMALGGAGMGSAAGLASQSASSEAPSVHSVERRHEPLSLEIDSGFAQVDFSPEIVQSGLESIYGPLLSANVDGIVYYSDHLAMPRHYHGSARFEAGHCVRSTERGARSRIVLTVDNFEGQSIENSIETLLHEIAHALDPENADDMPEGTRIAIRQALQAIVAGDQSTFYDYVNSYEGGSSTNEEEDRYQREELFAELIADAVEMAPLPPDDHQLTLSVEDRYTLLLSQKHGKTPEEARPYARILSFITAWRGQDFFERAQRARVGFVQRLQANREARARAPWTRELDRLAVPAFSPALQEWADTPFNQRLSGIMTAESSLTTENDRRAILRRLHDPDLRERYLEAATRVHHARSRYEASYLQQVHNPQLKALFHQLIDALRDIQVEYGRRTTEHLTQEDQSLALQVIHGYVDQVNHLISQADQATEPTDHERFEFRAAVLAWMQGEASSCYLVGLQQHMPHLIELSQRVQHATGF